ncbi:hypothetical protein Z043_123533, partial [Scleropages formosus]
SSGVVSSAPKSQSSRSSELGEPTSSVARASRRRLSAGRSPDSGIAATPLPSSRFKYLSWNQLEESELRGDQLACPRVREERLQLVDNALRDLSSIRLPRCGSLNLHRNRLTSIRQLPAVPRIQHLCLSENAIGSLGELVLLGAAPLESLTLRRNPCAFLEDYRARVFSCLPELQVLDGIPKLPEDSVRREPPVSSRTCAIL